MCFFLADYDLMNYLERKGVVHGYAKRKKGKLKEWGFIKR